MAQPLQIVIEAEPPSRFPADVEPLGSADWLEVTPVPDALQMPVPAAGP